jgi:catechol 2,3-dioxygenase-like lactoylglutathione lyase family enzyme
MSRFQRRPSPLASSGAAAQNGAEEAATMSLTRGVHHLALVTDDMRRTAEFYVDVLGMKLIHAMRVPPGLGTGPKNRGNPPYEDVRHWFFDMGQDSLIAFFELPKGAEPQANRNALGGMQHLAFTVTAERFAEIQRRLDDAGIARTPPIPQLPGMLGVYFLDPNGIRLEMACQPADGEAPGVVACVRQSRAEARAALAELSGGDAAWLERMLAGFAE